MTAAVARLCDRRFPAAVGDRARIVGSDTIGHVTMLIFRDRRPHRALLMADGIGHVVPADRIVRERRTEA